MSQQSRVSFPQLDRSRKPRDVVWMYVFFAFWLGMFVILGYAGANGAAAALRQGSPDYEGDLCGKGNTAKEELRISFVLNFERLGRIAANIGNDGTALSSRIAGAPHICVRECPQPSVDSNNAGLDGLQWVCEYPRRRIREYVANGTVEGSDYPAPDDLDEWLEKFNYNYYPALTDEYKQTSFNLQGPCFPVFYYNAELFGATCVPTQKNSSNSQFADDDSWSVLFRDEQGNERRFANGARQDGERGNCDRECIERALAVAQDWLGRFLSLNSNELNRYIYDLVLAWPVVLVMGSIVPLLMCIFFFALLHLAGTRVFVWTTILMVNMFAIGSMLFAAAQSNLVTGTSVDLVSATGPQSLQNELQVVTDMRAAMTGLFVFLLVAAIFFITSSVDVARRMNVAVATIELTVRNVLEQNRKLLAYSLLPWVTMTLLFLFFIFVGVLTFSVFTKESVPCSESLAQLIRENYCRDGADQTCEPVCGQKYVLDIAAQRALVYLLIGLLWSAQFLLMSTLIAIGIMVSRNFWRLDADPAKALRDLLINYTGTAALSGLVIAGLEYPKNVLSAIAFVPGIRRSAASDFFSAIRRFVNKNATFVTAIEGLGHVGAAQRAEELLHISNSNIKSISHIVEVSDRLLFIARAATSMFCVFFTFVFVHNTYGDASSPLLLVLVVMIASYGVMSLAFAAVEASVTTSLLSVCVEIEERGAAQSAPSELMDAISTSEPRFAKYVTDA